MTKFIEGEPPQHPCNIFLILTLIWPILMHLGMQSSTPNKLVVRCASVLGPNHQYMINLSDIMITQCVQTKQLIYPPKWQPIMISLTRVTLGWTPYKRWLITKPDKLPQNAPAQSEVQESQTSYPRVHIV